MRLPDVLMGVKVGVLLSYGEIELKDLIKDS